MTHASGIAWSGGGDDDGEGSPRPGGAAGPYADAIGRLRGGGSGGSGNRFDDSRLRALAMAIHDGRVARANAFGAEMFVDTAWDILTVLFVMAPHDGDLPFDVLCSEAALPMVSGRRWIEALADRGHVTIRRHEDDDAQMRVGLTLSGLEAMRGVLSGSLRVVETLTRQARTSTVG